MKRKCMTVDLSEGESEELDELGGESDIGGGHEDGEDVAGPSDEQGVCIR
jgi:hypothetical protein